MTQRKLIRGGQVVMPSEVVRADVLIEDERIVGVVAQGDALCPDAQIIDAGGCLVFPGVVDAHTHIQLDTGLYKTADNWEVGTRSAAFGGVTTVIDFATQLEGMTFPEALAARLIECEPAMIDYGLHMMVTDLPHDPEVAARWLAELRDLGVPSIKLYTTYRPNYYADDAEILHTLRAMPGNMIAMVHCENDAIVTDASQRLNAAGRTSWAYHGQARPPEAEWEAIRRVVFLAECAEKPVYIVHCSTTDSVWYAQANAVRADRGQQVFCETCPQYFVLNDERYARANPEQFILQPPLRPEQYAIHLPSLVAWGGLSVISTDHCDYSLAQKREFTEFARTPGGLPGLETSFQLTYTWGVHQPSMDQEERHENEGRPGPMPLTTLARLMATNPAKIFGLYPRKGAIMPGADADILIYDPSQPMTIQAASLHTIGGYCPYDGMTVQGRVRTVLSRGAVLVEDGTLYGEPGRGQFLRGNPFEPLRL